MISALRFGFRLVYEADRRPRCSSGRRIDHFRNHAPPYVFRSCYRGRRARRSSRERNCLADLERSAAGDERMALDGVRPPLEAAGAQDRLIATSGRTMAGSFVHSRRRHRSSATELPARARPGDQRLARSPVSPGAEGGERRCCGSLRRVHDH